MSKLLPLLALTHVEYAEALHAALGRGRQHAIHLYEEFYRSGTFEGRHPAFANASQLLKEMIALTDLSLPQISDQREEGPTKKFLLKITDRLEVESVVIPMQAGGTLCISSQVGCRMGCSFCETGRMGLLKNLECSEIVAQVYLARHLLKATVRNIVFMGMGEPFDNFETVFQSINILTDPHGLGFGRKNITISTSGVLEGIERMSAMQGKAPNLAISLNAPNDTLRNKLMPVNKKAPLQELRRAMEDYCNKTGRQILVAYVLMNGVNDSLQQAEELAEFLTGLDIKINLIPYNPQSRDRYACSPLEVQQKFRHYLKERGFRTLLRTTKGSSIMAACGQLGNLELRKKSRVAL